MTVRARQRNIAIGGGVVLFHLAALWALQTGLLQRTVDIVVPVTVLGEIVPPPPVQAPPPPPPPVPPPPPAPPPPRRVEPVRKPVAPRPPPAPRPVARPDPTPAPAAPIGVATPQPPAPPIAAPVAPSPAPPAPAPAPARVDLPSTDADYLQNPRPAYPPISKRLGEQGKVVVRVLIGADGAAQKAEIAQSSGFDRLDQAALSTVLKWRYVPGKRGGVPEAMWFRVPINFVLE